MLQERLNELIKQSILDKDRNRMDTLREIKTAFMNWQTAKENVGKTFGEAEEIQVLRKLAVQYDDTAKDCDDGKHDALVADARRSAGIVREFLPEPVTDDRIQEVCSMVIERDSIEPVKKNMGMIIRLIKAELPAAEGKAVSQVVMRNLH